MIVSTTLNFWFFFICIKVCISSTNHLPESCCVGGTSQRKNWKYQKVRKIADFKRNRRFFWSGLRDLNPRSLGPKLSTEYFLSSEMLLFQYDFRWKPSLFQAKKYYHSLSFFMFVDTFVDTQKPPYTEHEGFLFRYAMELTFSRRSKAARMVSKFAPE